MLYRAGCPPLAAGPVGALLGAEALPCRIAAGPRGALGIDAPLLATGVVPAVDGTLAAFDGEIGVWVAPPATGVYE